jgi:hypothetical protein
MLIQFVLFSAARPWGGGQSTYKRGCSYRVTQRRPTNQNALNVSIADALADEYLPYIIND